MSSDTEPPEGLGTGHPGTQRVPCPNYSGVRTHHLPLKNGLAPHASHAGKAERHPPGPPRPTKEHTPSSARHPKTRMRTCGGQVAAPPPPRGARPRQAGPAAAAEPREWRWGLAAEPASAAANRRGPRGQRRRVHVSGPPGPAALCAGVCVLKPPPASSFWDWHRRATRCPLCGVTRLQTTVPAPSRAGVSRASCVQGRGGAVLQAQRLGPAPWASPGRRGAPEPRRLPTPRGRREGPGRRAPTCSTRPIHWKLSSSEASGRCSATSTTRSSCSTVTENTAILSTRANVTARQRAPSRLRGRRDRGCLPRMYRATGHRSPRPRLRRTDAPTRRSRGGFARSRNARHVAKGKPARLCKNLPARSTNCTFISAPCPSLSTLLPNVPSASGAAPRPESPARPVLPWRPPPCGSRRLSCSLWTVVSCGFFGSCHAADAPVAAALSGLWFYLGMLVPGEPPPHTQPTARAATLRAEPPPPGHISFWWPCEEARSPGSGGCPDGPLRTLAPAA